MKESTLIYLGGTIIVLLLLTTVVSTVSNSKNKRNLNEEKLKNESLASQKLQVSQELDKAKNDITSLTTEKETTEKAMAKTESNLAEVEKRIGSLSKENSSLIKDRNELAQLQKTKADLDNAYEDLRLKHETALSKIRDLENSAIVLDTDKKNLSGDLAKSEMYRTDNIEIYGSRGNKKDKLTFCASRTKKINLNFDVPQNLTETISFKIITPSNTTITPEDKSLTWTFGQDTQNLTASLSSLTGEFDLSRKVVLTYTPKEKLKGGEYKIQILSNDKNIGNCRLLLK